ncbi:hypothetical protein SAMN05660976_00378 [Nonomuraea pusilla]|uniref:Uncharacterized protein n=1 Tax=Nonomuraea pusilla TaxID=46177 RepID=A0A1H7GHK5_9ACTN|nr:hypothetical protein SAMN05660976_00378 [Nonomuraea pusilla]
MASARLSSARATARAMASASERRSLPRPHAAAHVAKDVIKRSLGGEGVRERHENDAGPYPQGRQHGRQCRADQEQRAPREVHRPAVQTMNITAVGVLNSAQEAFHSAQTSHRPLTIHSVRTSAREGRGEPASDGQACVSHEVAPERHREAGRVGDRSIGVWDLDQQVGGRCHGQERVGRLRMTAPPVQNPSRLTPRSCLDPGLAVSGRCTGPVAGCPAPDGSAFPVPSPSCSARPSAPCRTPGSFTTAPPSPGNRSNPSIRPAIGFHGGKGRRPMSRPSAPQLRYAG